MKKIIILSFIMMILFIFSIISVFADEEKKENAIEDGRYIIYTYGNNNMVLDIWGNSTDNEANLEIYENNGGKNQQFDIKSLNDGSYEIVAVCSGKALDVYAGSKKLGTNVQQYQRNMGNNQKWIIKDVGNGYYSIISKCNQYSLDVEGENFKSCANICTWSYHGGKNQKFGFRKVNNNGNASTTNNSSNTTSSDTPAPTKSIEDGVYQICASSNLNFVLDVNGLTKNNGANVTLWENNNGSNQKFKVTYLNDGYYSIKSLYSDKSLDVEKSGKKAGTNVYQNEYTGGLNQKWKIIKNSDGTYCVISACNNLYLDINEARIANGSNIQMWDGNRGSNQRFRFEIPKKYVVEPGIYGKSGLSYKKDSRGSDLKFYKFGEGNNVLFATFAVHGWEDNFNYDGQVLIDIANDFRNRLYNDQNEYIAKNWTIYIFPTVNPDGAYYGTTHNGPGRTTLYSRAPENKGIDINRNFQSESTYKIYTSNRNYNGTAAYQAYEAEALKNFILNHEGNGKNLVIDLHGWENSLIGDTQILEYFAKNFSATKKYEKYGSQYLISWARVNGMKSALVELPSDINSKQSAVNNQLSEKYINSVLDMLKNFPISNVSAKNSLKMSASAINEPNTMNLEISSNIKTTAEEQFNIAFCGMTEAKIPTEEEVEAYKEKMPKKSGVYLDYNSCYDILDFIHKFTNLAYEIDDNGFLVKSLNQGKNNKNEYDEFFEKLINSERLYILSRNGLLYCKDDFSGEIISNDYEDIDSEATYDYIKSNNKMLIDLTKNTKQNLTDKEIIDSVMNLISIEND